MKKIFDILKSDRLTAIVLFMQFVFGFYFYFRFPKVVPVHWNASGDIDGYGSKLIPTFAPPIITIVILLLGQGKRQALPTYDPRIIRILVPVAILLIQFFYSLYVITAHLPH